MTGKEALIALANGEDIQVRNLNDTWYKDWTSYESFKFKMWIGFFTDGVSQGYEFRLKPRTITINGVEVPAPFEPKLDDVMYYLTTTKNEGYTWGHFHPSDAQMTQFGAWRTESEIKQVVAALRSIFK